MLNAAAIAPREREGRTIQRVPFFVVIAISEGRDCITVENLRRLVVRCGKLDMLSRGPTNSSKRNENRSSFFSLLRERNFLHRNFAKRHQNVLLKKLPIGFVNTPKPRKSLPIPKNSS